MSRAGYASKIVVLKQNYLRISLYKQKAPRSSRTALGPVGQEGFEALVGQRVSDPHSQPAVRLQHAVRSTLIRVP